MCVRERERERERRREEPERPEWRSTEESSYQSVHLRGRRQAHAARASTRRKSHSPIRALAPHTTLHAGLGWVGLLRALGTGRGARGDNAMPRHFAPLGTCTVRTRVTELKRIGIGISSPISGESEAQTQTRNYRDEQQEQQEVMGA